MLDGDSDAGIDYFNRDTPAAPSRADHYAASARITHRIGNQISNDAREERGIAVDGDMRRHSRERKTARDGLRRKFAGDLRKQWRQRDALSFRPQNAGFQARQV